MVEVAGSSPPPNRHAKRAMGTVDMWWEAKLRLEAGYCFPGLKRTPAIAGGNFPNFRTTKKDSEVLSESFFYRLGKPNPASRRTPQQLEDVHGAQCTLGVLFYRPGKPNPASRRTPQQLEDVHGTHCALGAPIFFPSLPICLGLGVAFRGRSEARVHLQIPRQRGFLFGKKRR